MQVRRPNCLCPQTRPPTWLLGGLFGAVFHLAVALSSRAALDALTTWSQSCTLEAYQRGALDVLRECNPYHAYAFLEALRWGPALPILWFALSPGIGNWPQYAFALAVSLSASLFALVAAALIRGLGTTRGTAVFLAGYAVTMAPLFCVLEAILATG